MMLWPKWVVLIAGSDRFCIKCCSSSQPLRHAGLSGVISFTPRERQVAYSVRS